MAKRVRKILAGVAALAALALGGSAIAGAISGADRPPTQPAAGTGESPAGMGTEPRAQERDEQEEHEQGEDEAGEQARGPQAERAKAAALEATGGGRASSVERDSENGATWEVEVSRRDGSAVDVRLDEAYEVVVVEGDPD